MRTDKLAELRKKVEQILVKSRDWSAWQSALETAIALRRTGPRHLRRTYCLDTSEVVEYLFPRSRAEGCKEYPTTLDLSLLIIFQSPSTYDEASSFAVAEAAGKRHFPADPIFILPPHQRELRNLADTWAERLREAAQQLHAMQGALDQFQARLKDLSEERAKMEVETFIQFILREVDHFGLFFSAGSRGGAVLEKLLERLVVPDRDFLGVPSWTYEPDKLAIEDWYESLIGYGIYANLASYRTDAHVLHMLEALNEELPDQHLLILSTHSARIWKVLAERRLKEEREEGIEEDGSGGSGVRTLMKEGISLVQRPEVALVEKLLDDFKIKEDDLVKDCERNRGLGQMRDRLETEILTYLKRRDLGGVAVEEVEKLLGDLEAGLERMKSGYQDRWRLERLRLALEPPREEGVFDWFQDLGKGQKEQLATALKTQIKKLLAVVGELRQKLSLAAITTPEPSLSFQHVENTPAAWISAILGTRSGSPPFTLRFQSVKVKEHLDGIQKLLQAMDYASEPDKETVRLDLQAAMYECEVQLRQDPEYYLLLASVYSSRQMWFQAYDATEQGLNGLDEVERERRDEGASPEQTGARAELLLARAWALKSWTRERVVDDVVVAQSFLQEAIRYARQSLYLQGQRHEGCELPTPARDPRCLRELGSIYGELREIHWDDGGKKIDFQVFPEDIALANLSSGVTPDLLQLFVAFSEEAHQVGQSDPIMRVFYKNSLLYALTEKDLHDVEGEPRKRAESRQYRILLADELKRDARVSGDPNFLDTLAWHHYALSKRTGSGTDRDLAVDYIRQARTALRSNRPNRYYQRLIARHNERIQSLA